MTKKLTFKGLIILFSMCFTDRCQKFQEVNRELKIEMRGVNYANL